MPYAIRLTIGVVAFVAEEEARATSARTKASLATAKTKGTGLGNPRLLLGNTAAAAGRRTAEVLPYLDAARRAGATTLQQRADAPGRCAACWTRRWTEGPCPQNIPIPSVWMANRLSSAAFKATQAGGGWALHTFSLPVDPRRHSPWMARIPPGQCCRWRGKGGLSGPDIHQRVI